MELKEAYNLSETKPLKYNKNERELMFKSNTETNMSRDDINTISKNLVKLGVTNCFVLIFDSQSITPVKQSGFITLKG